MRDTLGLLASFRFEQRDPDKFYRLLAENTVSLVSQFHSLSGARVVDVGGGPGDLAEAFRDGGAQVVTADIDWEELHCRPRGLRGAVLADGRHLPFSSGSMDLGCTSNVLEHVSEPMVLVEELVRVVRSGGVIFVNFTTWLSPFGGHETAPWHFFGAERAVRRYVAKHGKPPKNRFGETLFRIKVSAFLRDVRGLKEVELIDAFPRYFPRWTRPLLRVPGLRELVTLNLAVALRKK